MLCDVGPDEPLDIALLAGDLLQALQDTGVRSLVELHADPGGFLSGTVGVLLIFWSNRV